MCGPLEDQMNDETYSQLVKQALAATMTSVVRLVDEDAVALALLYLFTRLANTWRTIDTLWRHLAPDCPETFMVDAGTLVRAMFEAYVQAAFIVHDSEKRQERAEDYLEFEHVERPKVLDRLLKHDTDISRYLKASPLRCKGDARIKAEYERVKPRYWDDRRRRTRNKWYKGTLRDLAKCAGIESEYDLLVSPFHPYVHSSAYGMRYGPPFEPQYVLVLASSIAGKGAKVNLEYHQIELEVRLQAVIDGLAGGSLDTFEP